MEEKREKVKSENRKIKKGKISCLTDKKKGTEKKSKQGKEGTRQRKKERKGKWMNRLQKGKEKTKKTRKENKKLPEVCRLVLGPLLSALMNCDEILQTIYIQIPHASGTLTELQKEDRGIERKGGGRGACGWRRNLIAEVVVRHPASADRRSLQLSRRCECTLFITYTSLTIKSWVPAKTNFPSVPDSNALGPFFFFKYVVQNPWRALSGFTKLPSFSGGSAASRPSLPSFI